MDVLDWINFEYDDEIGKMTEEQLLKEYEKSQDKKYIHEYISRLLLYKANDKNIENILLEELYGKKIIDIIIKDNISLDYLSYITISKHPYLIEYFLSNGYTQLLENIKNHIYDIPIEGKTLIEYAFENNLINESTITSVLDCPDLLKYIKKYHEEELIKVIDPIYFLTSHNGKLLLDELLELDIDFELGEIFDTIVIEEILKREQYHLLSSISRYSALYEVEKNKTLFEFLLEKNIFCKYVLENLDIDDIVNDHAIEMLIKHKRFDKLTNATETALITQYPDKTNLEYLLEAGVVPNFEVIKNPATVEILRKYNQYELLTKCTEVLLMEKHQSNKYLAEELLERNLDIKVNPITSPDLAYLIYTYKRKDLYPNITLDALLSYYDINNLILDVILEEKKEDPSIKIKEIDKHIPFVSLAQIYLVHIRHGYEIPLTEEDLLKKDMDLTLLEYMIDFDRKTTLEKVITPELLQNPIIEMLVKAVSMEEDIKNVSLVIDEARNEYLDNVIETIKKKQLDEESQELIFKLMQLMNDGLSDKKALEVLEALYIEVLSSNTEYKEEIKRFIEVKQNYPDICIKLDNKGSHYCPAVKTIYINSPVISTLSHEIGHLLYNVLSDSPMPRDIEKLKIHLSLDKHFKESAKQFSVLHALIKKQVEDYIEDVYMSRYDESITDEMRKEIEFYIQTLHESEKLLRGTVPEQLNITVEEFLDADRDIRKKMMLDAILSNKYGHILAISDIFDAIYEGNYLEGKIEDEDGTPIIGKFGHGTEYYSGGNKWIFDEMIANYSLISKSSNSHEAIEYFKRYLGEELYLLLKQYYDKNIVNNKKYENQKGL